ncbi:pantoate--beta-alanine ligase [Campylobacter hyointestinalis subsp. lawsonii]|uniref:pantoate--beta-alanine ligase n=1 Tax=Campylobacter hyointestinalis TaxID=198 RepID=UPI000DCE2F05|nr:pantoate--beta-alanine ligase [Campylobacter hyointestinalis]RAZ26305.1 pantoate--beta-alanine ligase [Campylobacter hyointestinalis subsp. lawsonii]
MQILKSVSEVLEWRKNVKGSVGFVPTMGALHGGHASLIKKSVEQNDNTIVSIFVNPTQFLPGEDLSTYPRNEEADIKICSLSGASAIFFPKESEIYTKDEPLILAPKHLSSVLEGVKRPGHFDGVCRVLNKFFNLTRPDRAYFGKKDAQQLAIVQNMVKNFFLNLEIVPCEIVRGGDGLALSSRNTYLSDSELCYALKLSRALMKASNLIKAGELSSPVIKTAMQESLEPLKVDYAEIVNRDFEAIEKVILGNSIILVAAYVGKTRLIDNLWV